MYSYVGLVHVGKLATVFHHHRMYKRSECVGSSFLNSVFAVIYGMGTSSLNETVIKHALPPTDGAVIYECQSGVLSIIGTVKARTVL